MLALWADSPLSVRELATLLHLDSPTLSPLLKRLETAGVLTRTREEHNERQLRIELTQRGRNMSADAQRIPPAIISLLGIEISELEDLHASLTSLIDAAHAAGVRPLPQPAPGSV
jgi:DNA-binding MarR family transcriptional regulator